MAPRSPWRDAKINVCFGEDLPPVLRHHEHRRSRGLTHKWRPITNSGHVNKPRGGLWASPALLPEGKWRPIPRRSAWTEWCESEMPHWVNYHHQTQLFPRREAVFAVIDSAADACALYDAFPDDDHEVSKLLRAEGLGGGLFGRMINWKAVLDRQIAGVWLTEQGQQETHLPEEYVPSLYGWDAASVWFARRDAFTVGDTWPSPRIDPDPFDMGWDDKGQWIKDIDLAASAEAARAMLDELRQQRADSGEPDESA